MGPSPRTAALAAAALAAVVLTLPTAARAGEGEHAFTLAPRYAAMLGPDEDAHGVGLAFGYAFGLSDFFTLIADAGYAVLPAEVEHLAWVRVGATYTIDAIEWVPWLGLAVGGYLVPDADARFDGGASVGGGIDYRPQRSWSIGADVWYHALFAHLDRIPATLTAGLRVTWYLE